MRGDSVRDLYAKALALVLLGLLGATGALVDYWPVRGALPDVAFSFPPAATLQPLNTALVADLVISDPIGARVSSISVSLTNTDEPVATTDEAVELAAPAGVVPPALTVPVEPVSIGAVAAMGTNVELPAEPAFVAADPKRADAAGAAVTDDEELLFAAPVAGASGSSASSNGLLKKTGNQILNVGFTVGAGVATYMKSLGSAIGHLFRL